uniref:Alpha-defensin N-terminal domain-containing protein n=1 Tax=Theropithecus gelada TaxID=9565 RepID=A0A8D2FHN9_THEGE
MTTLTLLTAILLVPLQAQAEPLQARADEATAAQEQPRTDDQDFAISVTGDTSSGFRASGESHQHYRARKLRVGNCVIAGISFTYCCSLVD